MDSSLRAASSRRVRLGRFVALGAALTIASTVSVAIVAGASSMAPHAISAGSDIYLTVPGVTGDGSAAGGAGTIEVSSFSWGASNASITNAATSRGKAKISSITITKSVDQASPAFFKNVCAGAHYPSVTLALRKAGGGAAGVAPSDSMQIVLSNVFVSRYSMSGAGDEVPTESITLNFTKIEMTYTPAGEASISTGWDLKTNKAI
jgi:type VI secretion system secreted protein Hcp